MTEWKDPGLRTSLPVLPQLVAVLHSAVGRGVQATQIGLGVSGLTGDADDAARKLMLAAAELGASSVTLAHDSITAFLGALGDHRGSVVAAGTGVVTLAVGAREVARVDGWGNIISDAGSGYWIGRAAFEAALRDHDGRGPSTILSEAVRAEFPDLEGHASCSRRIPTGCGGWPVTRASSPRQLSLATRWPTLSCARLLMN
ncbi:BadF/BadG/BcrA/BcrD ATPase family protein [Arthrobacter sp. SD76]|uniref:BadF/BadG/BcrA/BcrD ATPase family protein n=1 Tax=Arthrobacter sp. SD76 TaxID=3415007 RepID=UPI003C76D4A3